jgi:hypothetical protein
VPTAFYIIYFKIFGNRGYKDIIMATNLPPPVKMNFDDQHAIASNWRMFRKEWEDYEVASELKDRDEKIRVATLRIIMGRDCAAILDNLDLTAAQTKKVTSILDALQLNFEPLRNVIYERSVFYSSKQSVGESIAQYVNKLRRLAASCEFTPQRVLDENIRDKLVLGVLDKTLRKQLLKDSKLTLSSAIESCKAAEQIDLEMASLSVADDIPREQINNVNKSSHTAYAKSTTDKLFLKKCLFCGKRHRWDKNKCPAYGKKCDNCGKQNHLATMCRQKNVHVVQEVTSRDNESSDESMF